MTQARQRFQNFEEYLSYDDGADYWHELFNGELVQLPPESEENVQIANRLFLQFALILGTEASPFPLWGNRVRGQGLELEVRGEPRNCYPDLTIVRPEHIEQLRRRNIIRLSMAPPLLVVKVVSPGELQRDRDYVAKRIQYQDCGIPEHWIINPETQTVLILELAGTAYAEVGSFTGEEQVRSPQFPLLKLKANELFEEN